MKKIMFVLALSISGFALANGGVSCRDIAAGTTEVFSSEATQAGDNLIGLNIVVANKVIKLSHFSVSRDDNPNVVYMGSDAKGNMVTLVKDVTKMKVGNKKLKVSQAFIRLSDRTIIQENMVCE